MSGEEYQCTVDSDEKSSDDVAVVGELRKSAKGGCVYVVAEELKYISTPL